MLFKNGVKMSLFQLIVVNYKEIFIHVQLQELNYKVCTSALYGRKMDDAKLPVMPLSM